MEIKAIDYFKAKKIIDSGLLMNDLDEQFCKTIIEAYESNQEVTKYTIENFREVELEFERIKK